MPVAARRSKDRTAPLRACYYTIGAYATGSASQTLLRPPILHSAPPFYPTPVTPASMIPVLLTLRHRSCRVGGGLDGVDEGQVGAGVDGLGGGELVAEAGECAAAG
jgi:hypothetical protein